MRIVYVTTCRSDYSPSYWLLHELFADHRFDVRLVVGGSHLSKHHGDTVSEIERDGWPIAERVPFIINECDNDEDFGQAAGRALYEYTKVLVNLKPDILLLYGDRFELLPIATAAVLTRTPMGHVCGGDITAGAIDDQVRHAVTKMAHVHFPSTSRSARRILQMGEEPWRVHDVGDPAIDQFVRGDKATDDELMKALGMMPDSKTLLVTFHPPTLDIESIGHQVSQLSQALRKYDGLVIATAPSPDPGANIIRSELEHLLKNRERTLFFENLGRRLYKALLFRVGAMVGNSSSGLIEASVVPLPVVNIGSRQEGRERTSNVIDVAPEGVAIMRGIEKALSPDFRASLVGIQSPYGDGRAGQRITNILKTLPHRDRLLHKEFCLANSSEATSNPRKSNAG